MSNTTVLFEYPLEIRWGDMDALGHVNNVIYFRYFEQARAAWLASIGEEGTINCADQGPLIITADATYLKPVVYPAQLLIRMLGEAPGRSSFVVRYEIFKRDDPETIYTTGTDFIPEAIATAMRRYFSLRDSHCGTCSLINLAFRGPL